MEENGSKKVAKARAKLQVKLDNDMAAMNEAAKLGSHVLFLDLEFALKSKFEYLVCEVTLVDAKGTVVLSVVVDHQRPYDELLKLIDGNPLAERAVRKFYSSDRNITLPMMTKHELGNSLSRLFTRKTILVEYSTGGCDGRLLEGTLADVERADVMRDLDSIRVVKCFRQAIPGLPNYELSTVFSLAFPGDNLVHQAHRAAPDAVMLQKFVDSDDADDVGDSDSDDVGDPDESFDVNSTDTGRFE
ncbi:MAG: hypothetical protein M1826_003236 [Phylliscum demangeonii]|nr:MAG: hypothetical protein M1826_003236 [Phylliscum demangeonii]